MQNHVCRNDFYEKGKTIDGCWWEKGIGEEKDWNALQENKHAGSSYSRLLRTSKKRVSLKKPFNN